LLGGKAALLAKCLTVVFQSCAETTDAAACRQSIARAACGFFAEARGSI
jgi:hypothetical protein